MVQRSHLIGPEDYFNPGLIADVKRKRGIGGSVNIEKALWALEFLNLISYVESLMGKRKGVRTSKAPMIPAGYPFSTLRNRFISHPNNDYRTQEGMKWGH